MPSRSALFVTHAGPMAAVPANDVALRWLVLAALGAIDAVWLLASRLGLSTESRAMLASLAATAIVLGWGAVRLADRPRLRTLCEGAAFMLLAWPILRVFNHLTMSTGFPLADGWLAAADAAIGFDWLGYALWLDRHPGLLMLMDHSYTGLSVYSAVMFGLLLLTPDAVARCREFLTLFLACALACTTIGMFFPAVAAATHYLPARSLFHGIDPMAGAYHLRHLVALRTDPDHVLMLGDLPGLVTFPSFHTAMGVVSIHCARRTRWLLPPSLAINLTMIASTPLLGSHYLVDVLGGAGVALAAILLLRERRAPSDARTGFVSRERMPLGRPLASP